MIPISNERLVEIAGRITRELFTSGGNNEEAERLVLLASDGRDLGGWVFGPVAEQILEALCEVAKETNAELARFQAIVGKLEKTADGVTVVPGMTVYWMYPTARSGGTEQCSASGRVRYVETMAPEDCRNMFVYPIEVETDNGKPYLRNCYSTREAAEEAAAAAGGHS